MRAEQRKPGRLDMGVHGFVVHLTVSCIVVVRLFVCLFMCLYMKYQHVVCSHLQLVS